MRLQDVHVDLSDMVETNPSRVLEDTFPRQPNGWDCGLWPPTYLHAFLRDLPPVIGQSAIRRKPTFCHAQHTI